jgi:P27 family predicted phage terminase small subunit
MGRRGPLPKPTKQKLLEGNPGRRALPTDEPEPEGLATVPPAPGWLPDLAKECWRSVARELVNAGMLAKLDLTILELLCVSYAYWRRMLKETDEVGFVARFYDDHGNEKYAQPTPEATLAIKYAAEVNRYAKVMGLGIAYRVGLHIDGGNKSKAVDPIMDMIHGGRPPAPPTKPKAKAAAKSTATSIDEGDAPKRKRGDK